MVMSLVVKLSTRVSYATAVIIFKCFCRWSPSTEAIEHLVLGLGAEASEYMDDYSYDEANDDEILVIEVDGKATPTATDGELKKRRKNDLKKKNLVARGTEEKESENVVSVNVVKREIKVKMVEA
ncbi:MAG: hypothetical protein OMM_05482 [Candidatus Magnetoglobus multicellularis str. Araruama]|uniref:Uncharacterized protein n=1 Tax=Candidatus Magnetoglobus multicellularis str. Araruama TaxID=890399 RepID=A0A1V1NW58_9BACT|nr:MAG: hypothetical protein OMM_05482 [Candidatus Magnetoglobus multicellularis str. Araruama]